MEIPLAFLVGALVGAGLMALARAKSGAGSPPAAEPPSAPNASAPTANAPTAPAPTAPAPTASAPPLPSTSPASPASPASPTPPGPSAPRPSEPAPAPAAPSNAPELRLVVYQCPQCGAAVEALRAGVTVCCAYCEASIRVEGARAERRPARKPSAGADQRPSQRFEASPPTCSAATFGRFEIAVWRQVVHPEARESMRWLPLDEQRAALFLLRIVDANEGSTAPPAALTEACVQSLRERADPGLAIKASVRAFQDAKLSGKVEAFVAVFDSERSAVILCSAGAHQALSHCSVEEGRPIARARGGQALSPMDLRQSPDRFANQAPVELCADDAVVVTSAGVAGNGRGWRYGQGSVFSYLREEGWLGRSASDLGAGLLEAFWTDREKVRRDDPPVGDLFVVALTVRSNLGLREGAPSAADLDLREFASESFDLALNVHAADHAELHALHGRRHALVWLADTDAETAAAFSAPVLALLDGETGDNENARRAGRQGLEAAPALSERAALVLYLNDEHGKLAFWTHGWGAPCDLLPRARRSSNLQHFDGGGEVWPAPGGRLLLPGALPDADKLSGLADLAARWSGGRASALYEVCREHEERATSAAFLQDAAQAARIDAPSASLRGLGAITRKG